MSKDFFYLQEFVSLEEQVDQVDQVVQVVQVRYYWSSTYSAAMAL